MPAMSNDPWIRKLAGKFVVFDGPDGSGKSTQLKRFSKLVADTGVEVCEVREPGGTIIGEHIRQVLLDPAHHMMDLRCEMMLYMASRSQLVAERIAPALAGGHFVLADRFISSTLAYQGAAGGLSAADILAVGQVAVGHCWPDLVVIFDVDEHTAAQRMIGASGGRKSAPKPSEPSLFSDRLELKGAEYHRKVRGGYLQAAKDHPRHYLVIDARPDADAVFQSLCEGVSKRLTGD
jgi:dTMP kinase